MTTLNTPGLVTTDFGSNDEGNSAILQPDGKIIVAGSGYSSNWDFAVARYNPDGTLDTTFSQDGKLTTDFGSHDYGYSVTLQSDGKIIVAGHKKGDDFAVARYNQDGTLDTTFSQDGKLTTDFGFAVNARSVTLQADGKIIVAGSSGNFALARYNSDGTLDTAFDSDGKLTTDFDSTTVAGNSVTLQADGKIIVAGSSYNGIMENDFAVARYK